LSYESIQKSVVVRTNAQKLICVESLETLNEEEGLCLPSTI